MFENGPIVLNVLFNFLKFALDLEVLGLQLLHNRFQLWFGLGQQLLPLAFCCSILAKLWMSWTADGTNVLFSEAVQRKEVSATCVRNHQLMISFDVQTIF